LKKCYIFHYKKSLTSLQKYVTNFITKSRRLHYKNVAQIVTDFTTKSYWLHYKNMLQISLQKVTDFVTKMLQISLQIVTDFITKFTDFITKICYKSHYKKSLTSLQISLQIVTDFVTKIYWLHYKNMLQISLKKVTDFVTKMLQISLQIVTDFVTKIYWLHYKNMLQISLKKVTDFVTKMLQISLQIVTNFDTKSHWHRYENVTISLQKMTDKIAKFVNERFRMWTKREMIAGAAGEPTSKRKTTAGGWRMYSLRRGPQQDHRRRPPAGEPNIKYSNGNPVVDGTSRSIYELTVPSAYLTRCLILVLNSISHTLAQLACVHYSVSTARLCTLFSPQTLAQLTCIHHVTNFITKVTDFITKMSQISFYIDNIY
jgi:hypothetical protein